jgi:HSP20 family protein
MNILPIKKIDNDLSTWHPFEEMSTIHERINQLFNRISGDDMELVQQAWNPLMDVVEKDNEIVLEMDVPGMEKKDLKVEIDAGGLTIRGERKREAKEKNGNYVHIERGYGSFLRRFPIPEYVDKDNIKVSCKEGILTVNMHKVPGKKKTAKILKIE